MNWIDTYENDQLNREAGRETEYPDRYAAVADPLQHEGKQRAEAQRAINRVYDFLGGAR